MVGTIRLMINNVNNCQTLRSWAHSRHYYQHSW